MRIGKTVKQTVKPQLRGGELLPIAAVALVGLGAVGLLFGAVFAWRFGGFPVTQQTVTSAAALAAGLALAAVRR